jgi:predicted peptidase
MNQKVQYYLHGSTRVGYLLHVPSSNPDETRRRMPVILFLHGAGERGDDPTRLTLYGLTKVLETNTTLPFIVVSPQCPEDQWWVADPPTTMGLLDHVIAHHFGDDRRVYLTGASMGGYGAWMLGALHSERFAAVVPVCGVALVNPSDVCDLKNTPVWALHGTGDDTVPHEQTERMVEVLRTCGGEPQVTYVEGAGHELGTTAYEDPALFAWLLQHTKRKAL